MINYLPGFFGPGTFLWFLLRRVPRGPGPKVMLSEPLPFFPIVPQDLSLFPFSPPFAAWQESPVGPDRAQRPGHNASRVSPPSLTLQLQSKLLSLLTHVTLYRQLQTSACPLFQHSHYLLLAYLSVFLQGVSLPSPILPYRPLHPSFITSTLSSSAPPPSLYPPPLYIFS